MNVSVQILLEFMVNDYRQNLDDTFGHYSCLTSKGGLTYEKFAKYLGYKIELMFFDKQE